MMAIDPGQVSATLEALTSLYDHTLPADAPGAWTRTAIDRRFDGFACILCGTMGGAMVPVGIGPRGQVFACDGGCQRDA